jgi:hypothetical protein
VVAQGNIIDGDELEMTSKSKTFAVALSREMVPTARIVVYFLRQPEEIVSDVLNFFVNGTRLNDVSYAPFPSTLIATLSSFPHCIFLVCVFFFLEEFRLAA